MMPTMNKDDIIADYLNPSIKISEICKKYGISSKTINKIVYEAGVPNRLQKVSEENKKNRMYKLLLNGRSVKEIASEYSLPSGEVRTIIAQERKKRILSDYKKGLPIDEIGQRNKVNPSYIYYVIRTTGAEPRTHKRVNISADLSSTDTERLIKDYRNEEMNVTDICEKYKISSTVLQKILAENGVPTRRQHKECDPFELADALAKEYSTTLKNLSYYTKKYNIPRSEAKRAIEQSGAEQKRKVLLNKAIKKYRKGGNVNEIASSLGISRTSFYRLLKRKDDF